ncbi:MAG: hypothetical protein E4H48_10715, partial [Syntrophobacterales bacterium]
MAFRENLLQKIQIDQLAGRVLATIGALGSEVKLDKEAMRQLLSLSPYSPQRVRDLDLYVEETDAPVKKILVLDNELPIYRTTVADVAMRKSPTVGEMAKIWNIVKILRDSDVKISRKADSLKAVQDESIARLDLSFNAEDINDIRRDGIASLESKYAQGVNENLALFSELLGFKAAPRTLRVPHCTVFGAIYVKDSGEEVLGPAVLFNLTRNDLRLTEESFGTLEKEKIERFHRLASGKE